MKATFVLEFSSGTERDDFVAAVSAGGLAKRIGDTSVEALGVHGGRRGKFAATIIVPISLSIAGNLATDAVRDLAKTAWEEILLYAHEIHAPPKRAQISDPPELIETELPISPNLRRKPVGRS